MKVGHGKKRTLSRGRSISRRECLDPGVGSSNELILRVWNDHLERRAQLISPGARGREDRLCAELGKKVGTAAAVATICRRRAGLDEIGFGEGREELYKGGRKKRLGSGPPA